MMTQEISTIQSVDIRKVWPDEAKHFTPWLAEHISELGDALGLELDPEATDVEQPVGNFRLDILTQDRDGKVAIENQLGETDHIHLGQLLTYVAGYDATVAVWIAGKFKDEHRAALDLLNLRTDEKIKFFGVVIEAWKIDNSRPAPHFSVVSAPNDWQDQKKAENRDNVSEKGQRYSQFFQGLVDQLGEGPYIPKARKIGGGNWQSFRNDYKGFGYSISFSHKDGRRAQIELYIDCGNKDLNEERFDQLASSKKEIEYEIRGKFDWERLDGKRACRISVVCAGSIHDDEKKLDEMRNWMIEKLPVFKKTFDPRLADLVG